MGSATSKTARKLPKEKPSWAGSRMPSTPGAAPEASRPRPKIPLAFESKSEADAKDPDFLSKLNQLGPVRVGHHTQTLRAASDVQNMYRSRMQSEAEASSTRSTRNRLLASSLSELLEARKSMASPAELETLAERYKIDVEKLHELCRVVNTPSIDEDTVVRTTAKDGEQFLTMSHLLPGSLG
ncbi:hypothetical protein PAXRUDRAFT_530614 [Paxillus rubicundulus Ve08.2h10]|uniref:Uncharacterized protein n=1 Tax=Paxillus rubicundulus Ve08.2h10 TaxID=930991 RepID=A0A0D0DV09_9AGAM|nr:hypothetical protein PAXRUDRAFT_530614 [Paxillus rubicundulus Ve08.2h10]